MADRAESVDVRTSNTKSDDNIQLVKKTVCVECGKEAQEAYKELRGGIIRLSHCEACTKVVDKYVEYDAVLIILDILLHKAQAYRHLLFNRCLDVHWQLSLVYLLCDAYIKWWYLRHFDKTTNTNSDPSKLSKNQEEISLLELHFYIMLGVAVVEFVAFLSCTYGTLTLTSKFTRESICSSFKEISLALLISSFAKTFVIPVVLWGPSETRVFLPLTRLLVMTSNSESLKVLLQIDYLHAFGTVLVGNIFVLALSRIVIDNIVGLFIPQYV